MFTHLLLLKKGTHSTLPLNITAIWISDKKYNTGGYMTYFGPIGDREGDYSTLLAYMQSLGHTMKPMQNPAEFILEVTGAGIPKPAQPIAEEKPKDSDAPMVDVELGSKGGDFFVEAYKRSAFFQETAAALEEGIYPVQPDEAEKSRWKKLKSRLTDRYASTYTVQFVETMKRSFLAYWRAPEDFIQKVTVPLLLALIIGTYFLQEVNDQAGAAQKAALLYFSLLISNLLGIRTLPS